MMNDATKSQMELKLNAKAVRRATRARRKQRAQWWFTHMRNVVDAAMEWRPAPPARAEQVYLALTVKRS